jgi:hypothetical protein
MKSTHPFVRYCVWVSAAAACAAAMAMRPPQPAPPAAGVAQAKAAYLDCAYVAPGRVLEPDLLTVCSRLADAQPARGASGAPALRAARSRA